LLKKLEMTINERGMKSTIVDTQDRSDELFGLKVAADFGGEMLLSVGVGCKSFI
jgi:hypothetical protein